MDTSRYMDKQITQHSKSQPFNFLDDDDEQEEEEENGDHGFEFNTFRSLSKSHNKVLDGTNLRVSFLSCIISCYYICFVWLQGIGIGLCIEIMRYNMIIHVGRVTKYMIYITP
jgi:hypothetical protein